MNQDRRQGEQKLAYVRRYRNAFRGYYLVDGRYQLGPILSTKEQARDWVMKKVGELERRTVNLQPEANEDLSATRTYDPRDLQCFDPTKRRTPMYQTIALYDDGAPAPEGPKPAIIHQRRQPMVDPEPPVALETAAAPVEAPPEEAREASLTSLMQLDGFVHDFVGSLHGGGTQGSAEDRSSLHTERFLYMLERAPETKGQVLGPAVLFGASPEIGVGSLMSFLGMLRKTGILRVLAGAAT